MIQTHEPKLWGIVLAGGEGTRVRDFLRQLCGGRGIKQFCAVIGRRSIRAGLLRGLPASIELSRHLGTRFTPHGHPPSP